VTAHPGEVLNEEFLKPLGMSAYALAEPMRVAGIRNAIVKGERAVTGYGSAFGALYGTSPHKQQPAPRALLFLR
jgi:antitoxin HigA-1